jgi:hypothetical protein
MQQICTRRTKYENNMLLLATFGLNRENGRYQVLLSKLSDCFVKILYGFLSPSRKSQNSIRPMADK